MRRANATTSAFIVTTYLLVRTLLSSHSTTISLYYPQNRPPHSRQRIAPIRSCNYGFPSEEGHASQNNCHRLVVIQPCRGRRAGDCGRCDAAAADERSKRAAKLAHDPS